MSVDFERGETQNSAQALLKYDTAISNLNAVIIDQNYRLDDLKKRNCNPLVKVDVLFEGNSNKIIKIPDLSSQIKSMKDYPNLNLVITATTSAPKDWKPNHDATSKLVVLDINYTLSSKMGTMSDLMWIRGLIIKKYLQMQELKNQESKYSLAVI